MTKYLASLAAILWLAAAFRVEAIPVHGTFNGTVTGTSGWVSSFSLGTVVTGSYGYDPALLIGNQTSYSDPAVFFLIYIDGLAFAGFTPGSSGLSFSVDANGMPVLGGAGQLWDLSIRSDGFSLVNGPAPDNNSLTAQVTYHAPVVPDVVSTLFLLGVALLSLVLVRHLLEVPTDSRLATVKAARVSPRRRP